MSERSRRRSVALTCKKGQEDIKMERKQQNNPIRVPISNQAKDDNAAADMDLHILPHHIHSPSSAKSMTASYVHTAHYPAQINRDAWSDEVHNINS